MQADALSSPGTAEELAIWAQVGFRLTSMAWVGLIFFGATALFTVVTLPVEFDASKRAKAILVNQGLMTTTEMQGVNAVLDAAALTYVAAALQAISTLLYYAFILMGRRD